MSEIGLSPLHLAATKDFTDCAAILLKHGCNITFRYSKNEYLLQDHTYWLSLCKVFTFGLSLLFIRLSCSFPYFLGGLSMTDHLLISLEFSFFIYLFFIYLFIFISSVHFFCVYVYLKSTWSISFKFLLVIRPYNIKFLKPFSSSWGHRDVIQAPFCKNQVIIISQ